MHGLRGAISSGSLTYTDSNSDSSGETVYESDTESFLAAGDYDATTTMPEDDTAYETGTETLGGGGTIVGGSDYFSWSEGDSTVADDAIAGPLPESISVAEADYNTYGFGESGTETITTGGADVPGSVSFDWVQEGTGDYQLALDEIYSTSNPETWSTVTSSDCFTDTVSASWTDAGVDQLTDSGSLAAQTDDYNWEETQSLTDYGSVSTTESIPSTLITSQGDSSIASTYSATDAGCDTLTANEASPSLALAAGTATYAVDAWDSVSVLGSETWTGPSGTSSTTTNIEETESYPETVFLSDSGTYSVIEYLDATWPSVPEDLTSGVDGPAVEIGLPEFKVAFYPDTNFLRGGELGLGEITPDNGQTGAAAPDPAEILTALAAPGRNPTDIAIPVLVGSEGSGGGDDAVVGGPSSGSTGGSSSAAEPAASGNSSGSEVASAGSSSSTAGSSTSGSTAASGSSGGSAGSSGSSSGSAPASGSGSDGTSSVVYAAAGGSSSGATSSSTSTNGPSSASTDPGSVGRVAAGDVEADDEPPAPGSHEGAAPVRPDVNGWEVAVGPAAPEPGPGLYEGYWWEVLKTAKGEGKSVVNTITGVFNVVAHPIQTGQALGQAIAHPIVTGQAVVNQVVEKAVSGSEGQGELGGIAIQAAFTPSVAAKAIAELKTVLAAQRVAKAAKAAQAGKLESVLGEAAEELAPAQAEAVAPAAGEGPAAAPNAGQSVAETAAKGFKNLECEQCAQNIQAALQKAGYKGQVIEIRGGGDFIVSKSLPNTARAISENGRHIGVRVGDTVFDNLHPNGIPFEQWINDFDAIGGIRVQSITEF